MLKARSGSDLSEESRSVDRGSGFGAQNLERDLPSMLDVVGEVDGRHPASPKLAFDSISTVERNVEAGDSVWHFGRNVAGSSTGDARLQTQGFNASSTSRGAFWVQLLWERGWFEAPTPVRLTPRSWTTLSFGRKEVA